MNPDGASGPQESRLAPIGPIERLDDATCDAFRQALAASRFDSTLVSEAEAVAPQHMESVRLPLVTWWLERRGGPDAVMARLFAYRVPVPRREVDAVLGGPLVDALLGAGVLAAAGTELESAFRLTPLEGLFILGDPPDGGPDVAMSPGGTTVNLIRLLPLKPGSVLDLGCASGTLPLLAAARGSPRAVGIDLNERAVALARFNARLNRVAAEFHAGDLLEPARGERFDLVLSQPPYVVHPPGLALTTFLHGGPRGDELALRFASAIPEALSARGRALLFFDTVPGKEQLQTRLRAALGDAPVDLVVLLAPGPPADIQALAYASLEDGTFGARFGEVARRYREHYETLGGSACSRALVLLARCAEPGGRYTIQQPVGGLGRLDAARLDAYLEALELAGSEEPDLLRSAVRLAPDARLAEERPAGRVLADPFRAVRFEADGLGRDREISEAGFFLFQALEEAASVGDAVARFAEASGESPGSVRRTVVDFVREGLSRALLVPRPGPAPGVSSERSSTP